MSTLTNSFETGLANGTTITTTNSGDGSAGNPFTLQGDTTGATCTYSDSGMAHGTRCMSVTVGSTFGPSRRGWSVNGANTTAAQYYRATVDPATVVGTPSILRGMNTGSASQRFRVTISAAGVVTLINKGSTAVWTSTALAAGTKWRIELTLEGQDARPAQVKIYAADSTTTSQDSGALTGDFGGPINEIWYGQTNSTGNVAVKLDDVGWSDTTWLGPAIASATVTHTWAGAVTDDAVTVSYGLSNVTSARLAVSTASDLSSPVYSAAGLPDGDGVVKLTRSGLTADTTYYYGIEADGTLLATGRGQFVTDPTPGSATSFSIAFGSCQQTNSNAETFSAIASKTGPYGKARRVLHEGDLHYRDFGAGTSAADVVAQYKSSLAPSNMQTMLAALPMAHVWDNHDWGGTDSNASAPAGPHMAATYRRFVPHYTLPTAGSVAVYQSFVIGRVRFIVLDTRSQRSNRTDAETSSKTMLGAEQKAWLQAQLEEDEPLKIIVSGIFWRAGGSNSDRWGSYHTEWIELRDWIQARPDIQAYVIFGDRHALAADDGTSPDCYLPQAGGAPFDQGSTASFETWSHGYYDTAPANMRAFGWLDITDSGAGITVAYSGITAADDVTRVSMTTEFAAAAALPARWGIHL